jgi:hypothetical protein
LIREEDIIPLYAQKYLYSFSFGSCMFKTIKQSKSAICFGSEETSYTAIKAKKNEVLCTEELIL